MIINRKNYVAPPKDGSDFKELFIRLATAGAGRAVDRNGIPLGPWTPELLAEAISQIDANSSGIEIRTVQLWFQENDKGISSENIRWLARIFGCGDSEASSAWQAELSASRLRLNAKRRDKSKDGKGIRPDVAVANGGLTQSGRTSDSSSQTQGIFQSEDPLQKSLALRTEALFGRSPLNMPTAVFACAVALGFTSFLLGNHDLVYESAGGHSKQVGFIWAPNWTLLFWIFMPLYLGTVSELVIFWKETGRLTFRSTIAGTSRNEAWSLRVNASNFSFWAVFLICFVFAGIIQWVGKRLLTLLNNSHEYATDWGTIAIDRPELVSVPTSIAFTGLAYFYMCICFYLFFAGLVLLFSLVQDYKRLFVDTAGTANAMAVNRVRDKIMQGLFRSATLGILIALCMKLQSYYLISSASDIISWLVSDMLSSLSQVEPSFYAYEYRTPKQFSSLLIVLACCFVFLYGAAQIGAASPRSKTQRKQSSIIVLLVLCYMSVNAFVGFSILLSFGLLIALYSILFPGLGSASSIEKGSNCNVL